MPKFVAIGYGDRERYDRTNVAIRDAAHAHDAPGCQESAD